MCEKKVALIKREC